MQPVTVVDLWLPILVSGVVVFVISAAIWMVFPHHKKDVKILPDDSSIPEQTKGLKPGTYMWPNCEGADMKSEEFKKRFNEGPWGSINVLGAKPNMLRNMIASVVVFLVISLFVGYITSLARPAGAEFLEVFRVAGAAAVAAYCLGWMPNAIWFGKPGRFWLTDLVDEVVYAVVTGLVFAWLWPAAEGVGDTLNSLAP